MIVVGDIGATSAKWRILISDKISQAKTEGFNYQTHNLASFKAQVEEVVLSGLKVTCIYMYIAGIERDDQKQEVINAFSKLAESVRVENDLLGAARAALGRDAGYVNILGTGANASYYNGSSVSKVNHPLGFILGDEGSGSYLGKIFLNKILRGGFSDIIRRAFFAEHQKVSAVVASLYSHASPNSYLASFVPFLAENKNDPEVYHLIRQSFSDFYDAFYNNSLDQPLAFVGSIAFHFSDILQEETIERGHRLGKVLESAIAGLALYHQTYDN